ncbi:hypothetical protein LOTGIDRAFT_171961 [Lottia gigantea]|uniref:NR LBD domain-containing protein n=1 Tax=Lottia gigantea TaxID=225164 RepID=V4B4Z1_LOTGI|nr:hypothetical protein LOTGIDRAFT_171961 [Lottia gigantea]ESP02561.1 hypothetical protein LOTGIDRAFT_171961 [Lottia gigantea]
MSIYSSVNLPGVIKLQQNPCKIWKIHKTKSGKVPVEPKTPETVKEVWDLVINGIPIINKRIIGFCNSVPGFSSLCSEDQQPMVKHAYYSIWMLTTSEFFINGESYLRFPNGRFYTKFWMKNFLTEKRVAHIFAFAEKFNRLKLTDTEVGILSAIQLMTYDCDELILENAQSVQILNVHYLDILVQLICESHPNTMCETLLEILSLFPHLCYINKMQRDMAAEFLLNKPPRPDKKAAEDSVKS